MYSFLNINCIYLLAFWLLLCLLLCLNNFDKFFISHHAIFFATCWYAFCYFVPSVGHSRWKRFEGLFQRLLFRYGPCCRICTLFGNQLFSWSLKLKEKKQSKKWNLLLFITMKTNLYSVHLACRLLVRHF